MLNRKSKASEPEDEQAVSDDLISPKGNYTAQRGS